MSDLLPLSLNDTASERARTASSFQFVYDQIGVLRRQVAAAVERGALSPAHAAEIAGDLDDIRKTVETGAADRSMSRADLRGISEGLHDIRRYILQAKQVAAEPPARPAGDDARNRPGGFDLTA